MHVHMRNMFRLESLPDVRAADSTSSSQSDERGRIGGITDDSGEGERLPQERTFRIRALRPKAHLLGETCRVSIRHRLRKYPRGFEHISFLWLRTWRGSRCRRSRASSMGRLGIWNTNFLIEVGERAIEIPHRISTPGPDTPTCLTPKYMASNCTEWASNA